VQHHCTLCVADTCVHKGIDPAATRACSSVCIYYVVFLYFGCYKFNNQKAKPRAYPRHMRLNIRGGRYAIACEFEHTCCSSCLGHEALAADDSTNAIYGKQSQCKK